MRRRYRLELRRLGVVLAAVAASGVLASLSVAPAEAQITFSGRSFGILVDPPLLGPTVVCDTGELPLTGGSLTDLVEDGSVSVSGQVLAATRLNCVTAGAGVSASSTVEIEGLECTFNQLLTSVTLAASLVNAGTVADCSGRSGNTSISGLTIAGVAVAVTGEANQVVQIPGLATLVINEQVHGMGEVTVNALHLTLLDGTECIIGGVHSDILGCPPLPVEESTWGKVKSLYR
ncbi:MAG TPA: choice-of-anchor P family protein [Candidatus Krumholzibacteria bacterium]|nr:choice-of-anchor P family protein [Candidatus Krumholzibacteria bacterium]